MLTSMRLRDFRCFHDSGVVELGDLNVFIGANNAGKSTLMSAITLLLRSATPDDGRGPLRLEQDSALASFDSVLRKHWTSHTSRASSFVFSAEFASPKLFDGQPYWADFTFAKSIDDGRSFVSAAEYGAGSQARVPDVKVVYANGRYSFETPAEFKDKSVFFFGHFPVTVGRPDADSPAKFSDWLTLTRLARASGMTETFVIRPYRPVPRSVYVVDDPNMSSEDRKLISDLLRIWRSERGKDSRKRISTNLQSMALAKSIEVKSQASSGPRIVEIRIAAANSRHEVTINDVGYGVSQILPLLVAEAEATNQSIIAYQPEAHLHPFAQSRLADVFVTSVGRGNRYFVETHSEHLVMRLQTLVAEGRIAADKVRVFCVERAGNESKIRTMRFHSDGRPVDPWPKGFLDTSLTLARQLSLARQGR
jgi:energy-coupling factor transporter ATP-binding protein EcfA2